MTTDSAQKQSKAQQGVFFITLSLGATVVVLMMLVVLLGYMLYRGSSRLFFSPAYEVTYVDGKTERFPMNQNLEFDLPEDGRPTTKGASQASKFLLNQRAKQLRNSSAPIESGTQVEVWAKIKEKQKDKWADDPETAEMVEVVVNKQKEILKDVKEVKFDHDANVYTAIGADGKERVFDRRKDEWLEFRQGKDLLNFETLVTYYLMNHPEESAKRDSEITKQLEASTRGGIPVDPTWKGFMTGYEMRKAPSGEEFEAETRLRELPPVASFAVKEQWNWFQFFWDFPRKGNTEGGVLPCIFGTVLMTLLMTVIVAPFGVAAAVYLMEYAKNNWFTHMVRLAIANLAGVPSIVFGLFGLGFFVMTIGNGIDTTFFGSRTVFGTPCVLWASLTMALLTLPVMIVASEEALRTVPKELREGGMALGATKLMTILTIVIPSAMSGILTGVILAVARGAGEVAPLLLTGVVAHKDQLPFSPLEKFMDLAYHVYDLSVKSMPSRIEEAQSLAFSSALVLVMVVVVMNLMAILLRARLSRMKVN